jgi:hypothetical protein
VTERMLEQGQETAAAAAHEARPWVERLARLGYVAKGVVYFTVGLLAVQAALGTGGETTDSEGALERILRQPFGRFLLAVIAVGLVGYVLWRVAQALLDTERKGGDAKGLATRVGYVLSSVAYAGLAVSAARLALGLGSDGSDATRDWTARLLAWPFGPWLVGLVALAVIGVGLEQLYEAASKSFCEQLRLGKMSARERRWAERAGQVGLAARGVTFGLIGAFLIQAALRSDANQARGLGGALGSLAAQPYGPWLLGAVAVGLIAYGVFQLVIARYRRIDV